MYTELYRYLIQYNKLSVPGIGTFLLQRQPAIADFPARLLQAPQYNIALGTTDEAPSAIFFQQLAGLLNSTERDAVIKFNNFVFEFKNRIQNGDRINWTGVGVLTKSLTGTVQFTPAIPFVKEEPVKAEKVIRQKAEHMVRVGEDEKTAEEMTTFLNQTTEKKSYWWIWAAVLALIGFLFLGWHLSTNGIDATGNQQSLHSPESPINTYSIIE